MPFAADWRRVHSFKLTNCHNLPAVTAPGASEVFTAAVAQPLCGRCQFEAARGDAKDASARPPGASAALACIRHSFRIYLPVSQPAACSSPLSGWLELGPSHLSGTNLVFCWPAGAKQIKPAIPSLAAERDQLRMGVAGPGRAPRSLLGSSLSRAPLGAFGANRNWASKWRIGECRGGRRTILICAGVEDMNYSSTFK